MREPFKFWDSKCHPNKEHELEKFIKGGYPITHLRGFEYTMELKCDINKIFKAKYFPMSLTSEARKWFYALAPESITSYH